jgi:hypothetical protein
MKAPAGMLPALAVLVALPAVGCGGDDPLRVEVHAAAPYARDQAVTVLQKRLFRLVGEASKVSATGGDGIVVRFQDRAGLMTGTPMITAHGRLAIRDTAGRAVLGAGDFRSGTASVDGPARDPIVNVWFTARGVERWARFNDRARPVRWVLDLDGRRVGSGRTLRPKRAELKVDGVGLRVRSEDEAALVAGVAASGPLPTVLDGG